jgi:malyl-CoA/(S)-citramalyl-CoA lyase
VLDDLTTLVTEIGDKLDVIMVPKVEGPEDIHYVDRLLAQLEARPGSPADPVHAILETARGVANVEEICGASPRMQGLSLGPADLAANRRMKTTRVGGGHPGYLVREDPARRRRRRRRRRTTYQQDLWHYTIARMVDACAMQRHLPVLRPVRRHQGHRRLRGPVPQRVPARLRRRLVAAPGADRHRQEGLLARPEADVAHAQSHVIEAMGDGTGAVMIDGKMEDDASVKQCHVMVDLAKMLSARDPELAGQLYGFAPRPEELIR